jgi:hypothetical protein
MSFLLIGNLRAANLNPKFIHAINMVEASGRNGNIYGDGFKARGGFQIHKQAWYDAVKYKRIGGVYADCAKKEYAIKIFEAYLERYGQKFIETQNYEALSRIWNGGPKGYLNPNTLNYWYKVRKYLYTN